MVLKSFAFNKLDELEIYDLPKMVNVWKKVPPNFQGFGNLTSLNVSCCDSLMYLFVPSVAKCLVKLQKMRINSCNLMKEVVSTSDEQGKLTDDVILFPQLKHLILTELPSLINLETPNVVESTTPHDNVNATGTSTSNLISHQECIDPTLLCRWSFPKLKRIEVKGCNLSCIFPANRVVQLPALEWIEVEGCKSLKYIFSSSTARSLEQLRDLSVKGCGMMTEVIQNDEEAVDETIKVVFHSLRWLKLKTLPNLEGICLGMVSFDWPLLTSLNIEDCSKMRIFTSGYSTTPLLEDLRFDGDHYNPKIEDMYTILRKAQTKAANLALKNDGTLMINGFQLAGEHLIAHYCSWSWEYSGNDKKEQYLIARNVLCLTRVRNTTTTSQVVDENKVDRGDDDSEDNMKNIHKPRRYDVSITYDQDHKSIRIWLKGYDDESKMDLPLDLVLEDITTEFPRKVITIEDHPYESGPHVSLFQTEDSHDFTRNLFKYLLLSGFQPSVQNHLQLCVDVLFPTIQFGPAP